MLLGISQATNSSDFIFLAPKYCTNRNVSIVVLGTSTVYKDMKISQNGSAMSDSNHKYHLKGEGSSC